MYQHPKWTHYKKDFDVLDIEQVRQQFDKANRQNEQLHDLNQKRYGEMIDLAHKVYGAGSKQHSFLLKNQPPKPPDLNAEFRKLEKHYNRYCEDEERKEKQRLQAQQYRERVEAANAQLEAMGYVPYEDFKPTSAITFLKEVEADSTPKLKAPSQAIPYTDLPEGTFARLRVVSRQRYDEFDLDTLEYGLLEVTNFETMGVVFNDFNKPCFPVWRDNKRTFGERLFHNGLVPIAIEEILETP